MPTKPTLNFSIDLPGVRDVFARDKRALKSIFLHFATTRPTNFRNPYAGPSDRWSLDDAKRFAHDFRLVPGVVSMPQLVDIVATVTDKAPGSASGSAPRRRRPSGRTDGFDGGVCMLYDAFLEFLGRVALQGFTQRPPFKAPAYAVMSLFQWLDRSPGRERMKLRDGTTLHFASRSTFRP